MQNKRTMSVVDEKISTIKEIASRYFDSTESCDIDYIEDQPSWEISIRGIINGGRVDFRYNLKTDLIYLHIKLFEQIVIQQIDDWFRNYHQIERQ